MPTKRVKYRGYEFEVYSPISGGDRWHVVMWPPNNSPPITTPTVASGVEAIAEGARHCRPHSGPTPRALTLAQPSAGRTRARPAVRCPGVATPEGEQKDAWEKMTDGSKIGAAIMVA